MFGIFIGISSLAAIVLYFLGAFGSSRACGTGPSCCSGCADCAQSDDCSKRQGIAKQNASLYSIDSQLPQFLIAVALSIPLLSGCSEPPPPEVVQEIRPSFIAQLSDSDFITKTRKGLVLLDAYGLNCPSCHAMQPHLEKVAEALKDKIVVAQINAETNPEFSRYYGIEAFPTLLVFVDGKLKRTALGYRNEEQLLELLDEFLRESPSTEATHETPPSGSGS